MPTGETITREILGNTPLPLVILFYTATALACGLALCRFIARFKKHRRGRPRDDRRARPISLVSYLAFHKQLRRDPYAGLAHLLTFHGFFILFIGTCLVAAEDYGQKLFRVDHLFFYGRFYLVASLVLDLAGVAMIAGLGMFLWRRLLPKPPALPGGAASLQGKPPRQSRGLREEGRRVLRAWWVAALAVLLLLIAGTGFFLEGARIARDMPSFEKWSVVGYATAAAMRGIGVTGDAAASLQRGMWIAHAALCVGFFALLPWRFFSHAVYSAASWATRTTRPRAMLRDPRPNAPPGAAAWQDLGRHDLLQADACTTCGRCNAACPAEAAGKPLHPREVVLGIRRAMDEGRQTPGRGSPGLEAFVSDDMIWACTTCGACSEVCPVGIEVYDKIVELRRGRVEAGVAPAKAVEVFENTAARANPFGKPDGDRMLWASGLNVPVASEGEAIELLYWIGCAGSFDADGQSVSKSMIRILNHLEINYRVLGKRERCTGDAARRLGEEGLFREMAGANIQTLRGHGVTRILTHCPHCFNTFKNEYPSLGGRYQVEHHSEFLARMIRQGRLKPPADRAGGGGVTFHDPCYLGRGNGQTRAPREVLTALPVLEMPRHGRESFCCGAGGGSMWLDTPGSVRVESLRAQEAAQTGAATIATGCPFCKTMLQAGKQSLENGNTMQVKDLAELVAEAL